MERDFLKALCRLFSVVFLLLALGLALTGYLLCSFPQLLFQVLGTGSFLGCAAFVYAALQAAYAGFF